ncbi:MAG: bifunctional metallophosphatase/5'-nucleotidase, partial [Clostridiaceae bacterium]|nr:bifunctional metallophosphatase/5'-nucleotidase [Clostridiaceae bacterium]
MDLRRLVILHSNDIHGDFFAKENRDQLVGGISMLSGYINKVRREETDPVLYVISGDMLQGSIIDQEYKGISTILVMNMLEPDVVTLGNHELDYGLTHL